MRKAFLGERIREWFCAQEKLCAESFPVRNRLEQTGCYSSPDTGERYDPDKKSQRTLVNFVDNRQFLCYNKSATWKKVFFLCLKTADEYLMAQSAPADGRESGVP